MVVEDDALLCDLISDTLRRELQPAQLHRFGSGREALRHCLRQPVDLLFTDLGLADMDGRELIRQVRAKAHKPRVIVLTSKIDAVLPGELVALGVGGFIDKSLPLEHVLRAVHRVLAGGMYFFADVLPADSSAPPPDRPKSKSGPAISVLSEREREIARLVTGGHSSREIAERLELSTRTVENHRARIMEKTGLHDTASLVRWCIDHGLG